ncbi:MAG: tetratricopeptide repeat protein [Treponema sp.]|nr:tetratricopeptide repeat protein [Treponema sp.]
MLGMIPVIMAFLALVVVAVIFMLIMGRGRGGGGGSKRGRGKDAVIKDATKRLAQNPRDPEALSDLGDVYFQEESWAEAMKAYDILMELPPGTPGVNEFEASLRYALSAMKLNLTDAAYKGFNTARSLKQDNFEVNYNLGLLEFQKKNYEKAIHLLSSAKNLDPDSAPALRYLGHAYFRVKKPREAMAFIRKAIELAPDDKESLYTLGECYYEANQTEQALRIFDHLRADPVMGPEACLLSGTIRAGNHQYEGAIQDFEIGLKHQSIKPDILVDLRYRLATAYLKQNDIGKALVLLNLIQNDNPDYKDVSSLIGKYRELNASQNLQIYTMAPQADFVALCRKIVMTYFQRAKVKITNISIQKSEWADILAEIDTPKWSDVIMFRFIRAPGGVGELVVRDFHSHLKDVKAGKGICITIGNFTEEAKHYTEARLIDLIEKDRLSAILNAVDAKAAMAVPPKKK